MPVERALADDEVARLAGRLAGAGRGQALLDDPPAVGRVLVEVLAEAVGDGGLDLALDLGVAELGLGLALELRLGQLDADDGGQALADVVAGQVAVGVLEHPGAARPVVERAVSAARKPVTWVPPSTVLMLLAKARTFSV